VVPLFGASLSKILALTKAITSSLKLSTWGFLVVPDELGMILDPYVIQGTLPIRKLGGSLINWAWFQTFMSNRGACMLMCQIIALGLSLNLVEKNWRDSSENLTNSKLLSHVWLNFKTS